MTIKYVCRDDTPDDECTWTGELTVLRLGEIKEARICARCSSYHIVIGHYEYGNYLCMPNQEIGMPLAGLWDKFWNLEKLMNVAPYFSKADAISVVEGIAELGALE